MAADGFDSCSFSLPSPSSSLLRLTGGSTCCGTDEVRGCVVAAGRTRAGGPLSWNLGGGRAVVVGSFDSREVWLLLLLLLAGLLMLLVLRSGVGGAGGGSSPGWRALGRLVMERAWSNREGRREVRVRRRVADRVQRGCEDS